MISHSFILQHACLVFALQRAQIWTRLKNPSVISSCSFPKPNWRTLHHISWAFHLSESWLERSSSSRLLIVWIFLIWNIWMWLPLLAWLMLEKRLLGAFYSKLVEIAGTIETKTEERTLSDEPGSEPITEPISPFLLERISQNWFRILLTNT